MSCAGLTVDAAPGTITPLINVTVIEEAAECFRHLGGGQASRDGWAGFHVDVQPNDPATCPTSHSRFQRVTQTLVKTSLSPFGQTAIKCNSWSGEFKIHQNISSRGARLEVSVTECVESRVVENFVIDALQHLR